MAGARMMAAAIQYTVSTNSVVWNSERGVAPEFLHSFNIKPRKVNLYSKSADTTGTLLTRHVKHGRLRALKKLPQITSIASIATGGRWRTHTERTW